ncbi:RHS repeat-associated core domain-containing protein [Bernardetia sp. OM2101]|uniref:RHS repeat domain-containing protein n=1 Tax=Bernardetia sp. OM2101 TaxID=3344876 RepID=UPI0035CF2937
MQDVDFKYNVRGWLTHINDSELSDTRDVFGMELSYETGFEEVQHNGNISGVKWKSATNNVERSYGFAYDKLGRLKRANYHAKDENTGAWTAENENYTVWDLNYDLDGNILSVKRNGLVKESGNEKVFGLIDDLKYGYQRLENRGLMLVEVEDGASFETASKDFKDGNNGADYEYNNEGSIISDKNKGVSFEYNHLGRVNKIINANNPNDKIDYLYDATGSKLQKIVKEGARTKKIDYVNGFQYRNDTLDFFPMPEGRIVFKDGEYIPEYHFKDHLGNLRLAFQVTDQQNARYALTMEADSAETEEKEFENVKVARTDLKEQKGAYSARLTNADKAISKTIKVEKGDKISAAVFATNDPEIAQTDPNKAIDKAKKDVLLSLGSAAAGVVTTNPTQQEIEIPLNPEISPARTETIKAPRVRLNLLDFVPVIRNLRELNRAKRAKSLEPDTYYVPRGELVLQLKDSLGNLLEERRQKITISAVTAWQELTADFVAKEEGEVTVFIDNSDTEPVYFDNLELRIESDPTLVITQEHHYYPFGMNMSGIERDGELKYQFNGMVEKEQAFGLELYETPFRSYDAQLGRFWQVEPLADIYCSISMYQFAYNNPVSFNDPTGLSSDTGSGSGIGGFPLPAQPEPQTGGNVGSGPSDPGRIGGGANIGGSRTRIGGGGYTWELGNNRGFQGYGDLGGMTRTRDPILDFGRRNKSQIADPLSYTNLKNSSNYTGYRAKDVKNDIQSINPNLSEEQRNWASGIAFENIYFAFVSYTPLKKRVISSYKPDSWIIPVPKIIIPDHIHSTSMSYSNGVTISYEYGGIVEVKASDIVLMETSRNQIATMITYLTYATDMSGLYSLKEHKAASFTLVVPYGAYIHYNVLEAATNANINLYVSYSFINIQTGGVVFSTPMRLNNISLGGFDGPNTRGSLLGTDPYSFLRDAAYRWSK